MTLADVIVEQFDFAIDAVVEVRNYMGNISAYFADPLLESFGEVDCARIGLASARLVEEFERGFGFDDEHEAEEASDEEAEQVRGDSNRRRRYSVPFEAGGSEVSGTESSPECGGDCESGPPNKVSRSLAWHGGEQDELVLHVRR